jgi:hypothetical protein
MSVSIYVVFFFFLYIFDIIAICLFITHNRCNLTQEYSTEKRYHIPLQARTETRKLLPTLRPLPYKYHQRSYFESPWLFVIDNLQVHLLVVDDMRMAAQKGIYTFRNFLLKCVAKKLKLERSNGQQQFSLWPWQCLCFLGILFLIPQDRISRRHRRLDSRMAM